MKTLEADVPGHPYPVEAISRRVWLHHRFPLPFSEVEELTLGRGIVVSCETVRHWCAKFGQQYASALRRRQSRPGDKRHLDEVLIKINGKQKYLGRAIDQDGNVLDVLVRDPSCACQSVSAPSLLDQDVRIPGVRVAQIRVELGTLCRAQRLPRGVHVVAARYLQRDLLASSTTAAVELLGTTPVAPHLLEPFGIGVGTARRSLS
ncbi:DDE-type integrase/transposase/recombinase [Streptomyces prasinus]